MAASLFSLLDDVAALAKLTAASLDDMATGAAKASAKSAGVIVDDAAVSPQYVKNVAASRELGMIKRIAYGSVRNKFLIIIPAVLVLSIVLPAALPVLLILGGSYLCFEGAEKVLHWVGVGHHSTPHSEAVGEADPAIEASPEEEQELVRGAVRTDLVLSAEIMLIALSNIDTDSIVIRLGTLVIVALLMTVGVYGAVALLVRMDDLGLRLAAGSRRYLQPLGRTLVTAMPTVLAVIGVIGTLAMLWVGGHLVVENLHHLHVDFAYDALHFITDRVHGGVFHWLTDTVLAALAGLATGLLTVLAYSSLKLLRR